MYHRNGFQLAHREALYNDDPSILSCKMACVDRWWRIVSKWIEFGTIESDRYTFEVKTCRMRSKYSSPISTCPFFFLNGQVVSSIEVQRRWGIQNQPVQVTVTVEDRKASQGATVRKG